MPSGTVSSLLLVSDRRVQDPNPSISNAKSVDYQRQVSRSPTETKRPAGHLCVSIRSQRNNPSPREKWKIDAFYSHLRRAIKKDSVVGEWLPGRMGILNFVPENETWQADTFSPTLFYRVQKCTRFQNGYEGRGQEGI